MIALCTVTVRAQTDSEVVHTHTLYRVDGSVLKGELQEWTTDYVSIKLFSGVTIRVETDAVRKVISRSNGNSTQGSGFERPYRFKAQGVYNVTTVGISAGPYFAAGATHAIGHRFSRLFSVGGGAGIESFDMGSGNEIVPVFAEVRGFLLERNFSPYYAVRLGHGFALRNTETNVEAAKGGTMMHAELGYRFGATRQVNFLLGLGIHLQKAEYTYTLPWESAFTDRITYRRTELRFGVIF